MHPLQRLLLSNRGRGFFRAESKGAEEATIYLYDQIVSDELTAEWWGGVAPQSFVKELLSIDAPVIHLRINSPGGDVFAGRVIEQAIRESKAKVIAHIDGYAASAASYVALAADEVVIAQGGMFMIHKAWSVGWGNSDDLTQLANLLAKIDGTLADTYVRETKNDRQKVLDWMAAETWFTADEAIAHGFADRLAEDAPSNQVAFDLSAYTNAPKGANPAPSNPLPIEPAAPTENADRRAHRARAAALHL
jgi:ATP-dependent Clp protease protease subunit